MELNLEMEGASNGGSEQASSTSDDGQSLVAFRKIMKKEVEVMVIHTVRQVIVPIVENLIRKVVKEEISSAQEKFSVGNRSYANEKAISQERNLHLKFLDEVSLPVLTGKPIEGKGGTKLKVGLFDKNTEQVVNCGPESSGRLEILVLDDSEHNWSHEDFNNRVIKEGDKTKPHFAKRVYADLKDGIGILDNAKLGHDSIWMKKYECRLGARMESFNGTKVEEAWTESFTVLDKRTEFHGKSPRPSLSDNVSKLKNIGKCCGQRLNENNIKSVKDFLFLQSIDPHRLQQIVSKGAKWEASSASATKWKATLDHAQSCIVDDKSVLYYQSSEFNMGVAFDVVGGLKGIIHKSHFIPDNDLSEDEKVSAHKLLLSAFENQKDIKSFEDEAAILHQFPLRSSAASISTVLQDHDLSTSEIINCCDLTEPGTSSQRISPPIGPCNHHHNTFDHFGQMNMEQTCEYLDVVDNQTLPWWSFPEDLCVSDIETLNWMNNYFETLGDETHSDRQCNAGRLVRAIVRVTAVLRWKFRARERLALGGIHLQKKQRTN